MHSSDNQVSRIVDAASQVFSEYSFHEATTSEVARRAQVSKRDIYAYFANKQELLTATVQKSLDENYCRIVMAISYTKQSPKDIKSRLEVVGVEIVQQTLKPEMSRLLRTISAESIDFPLIGELFYEQAVGRTTKLIAEFLVSNVSNMDEAEFDSNLAAGHFLALVNSLPRLSAMVGKLDGWSGPASKKHVRSAVLCFMHCYPGLQ